jgi:hypothetical protein
LAITSDTSARAVVVSGTPGAVEPRRSSRESQTATHLITDLLNIRNPFLYQY